MNTSGKSLSELIGELPPRERKMVRDLVEFLLVKRRPKATRKLRQDWAGALRDYRDRYAALELQRKALDWRSEA